MVLAAASIIIEQIVIEQIVIISKRKPRKCKVALQAHTITHNFFGTYITCMVIAMNR